MNLALLTLLFTAFMPAARWGGSWLAAAPVAALSVLSIETQTASWLGAQLELRHLAATHLAVLAAALLRRDTRHRLSGRLAGLRSAFHVDIFATPRDRVIAMASLGLVTAIMLARATLFVPEAADPYHLVKTALLANTLSIAHLPVLDAKINAFGFLYELALADASMGSVALQQWLGLQGPLLFALYIVSIFWMLRATDIRLPWYAVLLPCLVPAVFHQGILVKNDLFAALLALPALRLLIDDNAATRLGRCAGAGMLAGLAVSVKATMAPVALALAVGLPRTPGERAWRTRAAAAAGFLAGIASGGLVQLWLANLATYGTVTGVISSGNLVASVPEAGISLGRFVMSWFDASLMTRTIWPDRGGWGGSFGPAFVWALAILALRSRRDPVARRVLTLTLVCLVPFGLAYPDADLAHRLAIAPAIVAIVSAIEIEARRGAFRTWSPAAVTALACAIMSAGMIARSSLAYLRQAEYGRWPAVAETLEPSPGYLLGHLVWQMREVNAGLPPGRVCTLVAENALLLAGHQWDAAVVEQRDGTGFSSTWRPGTLQQCQTLILAPNDFPPPDRLSALALARCGVTDAAGPDVAMRAVTCPPDRPTPFPARETDSAR